MPPTERESGFPDPDSRSDLPARRVPSEPPITQEQLERVIRRASDLQFRSSSTGSSDLDRAEVVRIGEEVGIDARHVQQAIAEVRAEALVPDAPEDRGVMVRLAGPATVRVSRVVPGDQAYVERNLEDYLREKELLRPVRSRTGQSLWEPAGGLVSSMRRAMDVGGHGYTLAKAKRLQVAIQPLESGWSLVTLTADMSNVRNENAGGWFAGLGLPGVGGAVALIVGTGGAALAIVGGIALIGGAVAGATVAARFSVRKQRLRMELALQGLLDRLERGETLEPDGEPWHQKLLRSAGIETPD
ncbi:MAG: hypothetical protein ACC682_00035 [Gemmatimonadota bacterium]